MFKKLFTENKNHIIFDIMVDGNSVFNNTNVDVIERKLKTKKYSKLDWTVIRNSKDGIEDITDLFK